MIELGDVVKVRPPKKEWRTIPPQFIEPMDKYVSKYYRVERINKWGWVELENNCWQWNPRWLKLVNKGYLPDELFEI